MFSAFKKLFGSDVDRKVNDLFINDIQKPLRQVSKSRQEDIKRGVQKGDTATLLFIATGGVRHGR